MTQFSFAELSSALDVVMDDYTDAGHRRNPENRVRLGEVAAAAGVSMTAAAAVLAALADHLEQRAFVAQMVDDSGRGEG